MSTDIPALLSAAGRYKSDLTAFLRDLVRIPTVNGRDTEAPLAIRIEEEARKLGLESSLVGLQPERPNILVTYGGGPDCFALIAHMDTVIEGDSSGWSSPPFAAEVKEGRMIGRGAADNKAGIACGLYTLALLRDLNLIDPSHQRWSPPWWMKNLGPAVRLGCVTYLISACCKPTGPSIHTPAILFALVTVA